MILPCIDGNLPFPAVDQALDEPDGLLCYGGDLTVERLVAAYQHGIFPWYSAGEPILWWSPAQRMVLRPDHLHISRSFKKSISKQQPIFHINRDFKTVIAHCAHIPRKDHGTWIHPEMIAAYCDMFEAGHGFCLEVEIDQQLAGGIYGVQVGHVLCGESMFSTQTNGSKFAMYGLCQHMIQQNISLLDCQIYNEHLASMGAELMPREAFIDWLTANPQSST